MIENIFVVDASAHSYNLGEDNYAAGRYSRAVVDAFHGAHHGLVPVGYGIPREQFTGLESGALKPVIGSTFKFNEMRQVHRYMETNGQFGKIVVTV